MTISTGGSSSRRRISAISQPTARPMAMPPAAPRTKLVAASHSENVPLHGGHHRHPVEDEGGAVVDQALALEDVDDPARDRLAAGDRGRRDWVGRRHDRAERERRRPREVVDHGVRHDRDGRRRPDHEPDRQHEMARRSARGRAGWRRTPPSTAAAAGRSTSTSSGSSSTSGSPGKNPSARPPTTSTIGYGHVDRPRRGAEARRRRPAGSRGPARLPPRAPATR